MEEQYDSIGRRFFYCPKIYGYCSEESNLKIDKRTDKLFVSYECNKENCKLFKRQRFIKQFEKSAKIK